MGSMSSLSDQGFSEPASRNKIHWTIHVFWTIRWYSAHHDIIISGKRAHFSNIMVLGAKPTWRHRELATAGKVEPQLCNRLRCWGSRLLLLRKLQRSTNAEIIPIPRFCWIVIQSCSIISIAAGVCKTLALLHHRPLPKVEAKKAKNAENRQQDTEALWLQQALNWGKKTPVHLCPLCREHLLVGFYQTCTFTHLFDTLVREAVMREKCIFF